jgi:hypothetical protein
MYVFPRALLMTRKGNIEKFKAALIGDRPKRKMLYDNAARVFPALKYFEQAIREISGSMRGLEILRTLGN